MVILACGQVGGTKVTGHLFQQQVPDDQPILYLLAVMDLAGTVRAGVLLCLELPPDHPALIDEAHAAIQQLADVAALAERPDCSLMLEHMQPAGGDRRLDLAACHAFLVQQYLRLSVWGRA